MGSELRLWLLNAKSLDDDIGILPKLPADIKPEDIRLISSGGSNCLTIVSKKGTVFTSKSKDGNPTEWIQPSGLSKHSTCLVDSGTSHWVGLSTEQEVLAWGKNKQYQIGRREKNGKQKNSFHNASVIPQMNGIKVVDISCGNDHTMCLSEDGHIYTWGSNGKIQLGGKELQTCNLPQIVESIENIFITQITAGGEHSFALSSSGQVFGWGFNKFGQLGFTPDLKKIQNIPTECPSFCGKRMKSISCGENHTAFLTEDGGVFTCGSNSCGQLGHDRITTMLCKPQQIELLKDKCISQIKCGRNYTVAYDKSSNVVHIFGVGDTPQSITLPHQQIEVQLACGKGFLFVLQQSQEDVDMQIKNGFPQLTLDVVEEALKNNTEEKELKSMLARIFSKASCINGSFMNNRGCSKSSHGLDLCRAERCFLEIRHLIPVEILCSKLLKDVKYSFHPGPESLHIYLLLPACLYLDGAVFMELADHILGLPSEFKKILDIWLKKVSKPFFKRYVLNFKLCLAKLFQGLHGVTDATQIKGTAKSVEALVQILDFLNEINLTRTESISHEQFYLKNLINLLNIEGDYELLLEDREGDSKFRFCKYPFLYNTAAKCSLLRCQCENMIKWYDDACLNLNIPVEKDTLIEDTRKVIENATKQQLCLRLQAIFTEDIDYCGKGIRQEYFQDLFSKLLDKEFGAVVYEEVSEVQWFKEDAKLDDVYFLGLMCGLALYNGAMLHLQFPPVLYKKLLNRPVVFRDLLEFKPVNYRSLLEILNSNEEEIEDIYCLDFSDLCPNGSEIPVTQSNKREYVNKMTDFYVNRTTKKQFDKFYEGFFFGFPKELLNSFHPTELETILVGEGKYDFKTMEKVTKYEGGFSKYSPTVKMFWKVFHEMKLADQKKFIKFVTGTHRIPAHGIERLELTLMPRWESNSNPDAYLIQVYTCTYTVTLPCYTCVNSMKQNILTAIGDAAGFTML